MIISSFFIALFMIALRINNLSKQYNKGPLALDNVSLELHTGDFFCLLGKNGAGKSTLIHILAGLSDADSGEFCVFGKKSSHDKETIRSFIGLVPQEYNANIFETVIDIVVQQAGYFGIPRHIAIPRAEKILADLSLLDKASTISKNLSGGMKRRLMIARALIHQPKLLILDEPTAGVDPELRKGMWTYLEHLNKQGTTIFLTTHYLEEAEALCNTLAIIQQGKIITQGKKKQLLDSMESSTYTLEGVFPPRFIEDFHATILNDHSIEISIPHTQNIAEIFARAKESGVHVSAIRPSTNRLEQLFTSLTQ